MDNGFQIKIGGNNLAVETGLGVASIKLFRSWTFILELLNTLHIFAVYLWRHFVVVRILFQLIRDVGGLGFGWSASVFRGFAWFLVELAIEQIGLAYVRVSLWNMPLSTVGKHHCLVISYLSWVTLLFCLQSWRLFLLSKSNVKLLTSLLFSDDLMGVYIMVFELFLKLIVSSFYFWGVWDK